MTFLSTAVENDMQCATATGVPDTMSEGTEVLGVSIIADSTIPPEYVVNGDGTMFTEFVNLNVLDDDGKSYVCYIPLCCIKPWDIIKEHCYKR